MIKIIWGFCIYLGIGMTISRILYKIDFIDDNTIVPTLWFWPFFCIIIILAIIITCIEEFVLALKNIIMK